jgi:hypothetical protein
MLRSCKKLGLSCAVVVVVLYFSCTEPTSVDARVCSNTHRHTFNQFNVLSLLHVVVVQAIGSAGRQTSLPSQRFLRSRCVVLCLRVSDPIQHGTRSHINSPNTGRWLSVQKRICACCSDAPGAAVLASILYLNCCVPFGSCNAC